MYIRLKHALSALALRAFKERSIVSGVVLLCAYVRSTEDGGAIPRETVEEIARALSKEAGLPIEIRWDIALEFLERDKEHDTVTLRAEYQPHFQYLRRHITRLWEALTVGAQHGVTLQNLSKEIQQVQMGLQLFNHGLFFECHEYLEEVWRSAPEEDRRFYHGLIQVAAAFYHYEKGNLHGARMLLQRGLEKLDSYGPTYLGVDLDALRRQLIPRLKI